MPNCTICHKTEHAMRCVCGECLGEMEKKRYGHWTKENCQWDYGRCSECGCRILRMPKDYKYCPYCGAEMEANSCQPTIDPIHAAGACRCRECKHFKPTQYEMGECLTTSKGVVTIKKDAGFCDCSKRQE